MLSDLFENILKVRSREFRRYWRADRTIVKTLSFPMLFRGEREPWSFSISTWIVSSDSFNEGINPRPSLANFVMSNFQADSDHRSIDRFCFMSKKRNASTTHTTYVDEEIGFVVTIDNSDYSVSSLMFFCDFVWAFIYMYSRFLKFCHSRPCTLCLSLRYAQLIGRNLM